MIAGENQNASLYKITAAHYLVSAICFLVLAVMFLFSTEVFGGHYFHPKLLALTHLAALGWASLIIFGACYQLLPVVLETGLYSFKLAWLSFLLFVPGLVLLVQAFWVFEPGTGMQMGAVMLLSGILLFALNAVLTSRKKQKKETLHEEFIITACFWLIGTALLGLLLVFNFRYAFLPKDHLHFLKLHAHMGIAGWFLLLVIGVSAKLIPMFLVSKDQRHHLLSWSYYLINGALLTFLVDTYISGLNVKTIFLVLIGAAGIITYLIYVYYCFRSRIKKAIDLPVRNTVLSVVLLSLAVAILPFILYYHLKGDPQAVRLTNLYGTVLFMGWITAIILGKTFKTLPFIVWVKHYEHLAGKGKTPLPAELYKNGLLKLQTIFFVLFCFMFFAGLFLELPLLVKGGLFCLLLTATFYLMNVLVLLLHKTKNAML